MARREGRLREIAAHSAASTSDEPNPLVSHDSSLSCRASSRMLKCGTRPCAFTLELERFSEQRHACQIGELGREFVFKDSGLDVECVDG